VAGDKLGSVMELDIMEGPLTVFMYSILNDAPS
jgi:hypothetical protein